MPATIEIDGQKATVTDYEWSSSDKEFAEMLTVFLDPTGPSGADPNPDWTAAQAAIDALGGKILSFDIPPFDPNVAY